MYMYMYIFIITFCLSFNSLLNERPIRAYSVGSRLEHNKRKMRVDMLNADQGNHSPSSRVRAFSVGSRAKVARSDLYHGSMKTASQDIANLISTINRNNKNNNNNNNNISTMNFNNNNNNTIGSTTTTKSGNNNNNSNKRFVSTPLLANTKSNSVDPMDDLMEIDFTKKDDDSLSTDSNYEHKHISCDDLMEIDYPQYPVYGSSGSATTPKTGPHRRKSTNVPVTGISTPVRMSQPMPIVKRSEAHTNVMPIRQSFSVDQVEHQKDKDGYMSMKPIGSGSVELGEASRTSTSAFNKNVNKLSSSPLKTIGSKVQTQQSQHRQDQTRNTAVSQINTDDYLNMSPVNVRTTIANQQHQQVPQITSGSAPEGYMEMSWGKSASNQNTNNHNNLPANLNTNEQSSFSSISSSNEYISMNFGGNIPRTSSASSDCSSGSTGNRSDTGAARTNVNSRLRSHPITIKSKKTQQQQQQQTQSVNQPPNHHYTAGKIFPPSYLELNKVSSALTTSDSSTYSGIATPTVEPTVHSTSTIFPFSPNSPNSGTNKQPFSSQQLPSDEQKRKCLIDGTTGIH